MDVNQLIERQVHIRASDIFDTPAMAVVKAIDPDSQALLLELAPSVQIDGRTYSIAVAHPRLQRDDLGVLLRDGTLGCSVTCVPHDRYDSMRPFDLSWWRGGGAAIDDLVLR